MAVTHQAVFFDKDGTLVENVPYNVDPRKIRLAAGAGTALRAIHAAGYLIVVVTNQPGVATGRFDEHALEGVEKRLRELLTPMQVPLTAMYWCPHLPGGSVARYAAPCACRKPKAGMLWRAAREHDIDLAESWMVGDILDDVEAGRRAGCRTVLLDVGHETEWKLSTLRLPHVVAPNLVVAAEAILTPAAAPSAFDVPSASGHRRSLQGAP